LRKELIADYDLVKETIDSGDFVYVEGRLFITKRGEESLLVRKLMMLAKSLRPIPMTYYGLKDKEVLLRKRYLDLLVHPELKNLFKSKAVFWNETRLFLQRQGFLEVETPVLETVPGGAEAEPFITYYKALNRDYFLRISPELSLKRLLIAGFEKVFEIGRIFRNEGIDSEHLQDYTQMEMYWAYQDYGGLMKFVESMVKEVVLKVIGSYKTQYSGHKLNWNRKWPKLKYVDLLYGATGLDVIKCSRNDLLKCAKHFKIEAATGQLGRGRLIDLIYKKTVRPKLIQPAFLIDPPVDIEPLAKRSLVNSKIVERFQIVAGGTELGKGFSELNDPQDQRNRFEEQMKLREKGDNEAQMIDEEYLEAMEYGMPPAAGFAYSERLFAILVNKSVRETVFFPAVRSKDD